MPGFLQNAKGEYSHTKGINTLISVCTIAAWLLLCWHKKELIPIDPTILGLIGVPAGINTFNKFIENNADKQKILNEILAKIKANKK